MNNYYDCNVNLTSNQNRASNICNGNASIIYVCDVVTLDSSLTGTHVDTISESQKEGELVKSARLAGRHLIHQPHKSVQTPTHK